MELMSKPFKEWTSEEFDVLFEYYDEIISILEYKYREKVLKIQIDVIDPYEHKVQLNKLKQELFVEKRLLYQDFINKMYVESCKDLPLVREVNYEEAGWIAKWVDGDLMAAKQREPGRKADSFGMSSRQKTGSTSELNVMLQLGGTRADFDKRVGNSKNFSTPDLQKFLGDRLVGVKSATLGFKGKLANFPLINYAPKDNTIYPQVIVGKQNLYNKPKCKFKCYTIGVASPADLFKYSKALFTLDPSAHTPNKRGGQKYGFWNLLSVKRFETKKELEDIIDSKEFQPLKL